MVKLTKGQLVVTFTRPNIRTKTEKPKVERIIIIN